MLKTARASLSATGGLSVLVACLAIGWGLSTLQKVAKERTDHLDRLAEAEAEQMERLQALARQRHPSAPRAQAEPQEYPAAADLDPPACGEEPEADPCG